MWVPKQGQFQQSHGMLKKLQRDFACAVHKRIIGGNMPASRKWLVRVGPVIGWYNLEIVTNFSEEDRQNILFLSFLTMKNVHFRALSLVPFLVS
jgi:hypothetical protein